MNELHGDVLGVIVTFGCGDDQSASGREDARQVERGDGEIGHDSLDSGGVSGTSAENASTSSS